MSVSSSKTKIPITFPSWMFTPLTESGFQDIVELASDNASREKLSKAAVVGGTALTVSLGVLGHTHLLNEACSQERSESTEILDEWLDNLDIDIKNLIRCAFLTAYQIEPGKAASVGHKLAAGSLGHGVVRPLVENEVQNMLPWDTLLENGVAEAAGLGVIQGYLMLNDVRRCQQGELTADERNVSIAKRAGVTGGAAVGQTFAVPVGMEAFFWAGTGILVTGAALGPAIVAGAVVGGAAWLGCTVLGGVVGSKMGEKAYRAVRPKDLVGDALSFFALEKNDHIDIKKLGIAYQNKINEIIKEKRDIEDTKAPVFQCNRHLVWLLEDLYPNAVDVLGINKASIEGPIRLSEKKNEEPKKKELKKSWWVKKRASASR